MKKISRREFIRESGIVLAGSGLALFMAPSMVNSAIGGKPTARGATPPNPSREGNASAYSLQPTASPGYDWTKHEYGYTIEIDRCIGCGMCAQACKAENSVPDTFYRTWVERYSYLKNGEVRVDSPNGAIDGFKASVKKQDVDKSFFVPKLCNHCRNPRCVQVCPVGAAYKSKEGVVLIDKKHCVGCAYCVQACPYGARYIHPKLSTADKCTWCYHRITKGMLPACVLACPRKARKFGDLKDTKSEVYNLIRIHRVQELKPELKTHPRVSYIGLDKEVR